MKMRNIIAALLFSVLLSGCLGTASRTNDLYPGMTQDQVRKVMGKPKQTEFVADKWVWKYTLQQPWVGYIPYYLAFDKETRTLESWFADMNEYHRQQTLWLEAMPPTQHIDVDANVKVDGSIRVK